MENNPTTDNTVTPANKPAPVMDIQPPSAVPPVAPEVVQSMNEAEVTTEPPAEPVVQENVPAAAPAETKAPDTEKPAPLVAEQPAHPEHHTPILAISAALVIAILLAVAAVFAYKYSQPDKTDTSKTQTTTQQPAVTAQDVDNTNKQIDDSLATTNDDTEFNSADLNDTALTL